MQLCLQLLRAAALLVAFATPSLGDTHSDCSDSDTARSIAACTFIIDAGARSTRDIAIARYHRGNAFALQNQHQRAIEDYTEAIVLHPDFPQPTTTEPTP